MYPEQPEPAVSAAPAVDAKAELAKKQAALAKDSEILAAALKQVSKGKSGYRIAAADLINITVYPDSKLSRKVRVNQDGTIALPLIGVTDIGGMTVVEAQNAIEGKLEKYLVSPQASLFIEEYGNKTVFVMGEVQKPGSFPIPPESRMTVLEAISTAGGFTPVAAQDRTRVLRNVDGKSVSYTIEVNAITQQGQKEKDMVLEPNDVVFVPQSFF
jgi:protein involved in polysaccharide export with SLBB domain